MIIVRADCEHPTEDHLHVWAATTADGTLLAETITTAISGLFDPRSLVPFGMYGSYDDVTATEVCHWKPEPESPRWLTTSHLSLESNFGGFPVDICAACGAVVPHGQKTLHEQWHDLASMGAES